MKAYIIGRNSFQSIKKPIENSDKMHKLDKRKVFKTNKM